MNYQEVLEWMYRQLPMYQRQGKSAFRKDLDNIRILTKKLGHPELNFKSIHVAGTNGKGSVCHMLASIFQEAGYKTGLHTSPHLVDFRERIKINGEMASRDFVIKFIESNKTLLKEGRFSFFEISVTMAFEWFSRNKVDIAIIEVGMGGRLDSTNIISPELSVITNIGLDHTRFLGNTLAEIAGEKAGIIKKNTPVVIGETQAETQSVFKKIATEKEAPIFFADKNDFKIPVGELKGTYQKKNIRTVLQSVSVMQEQGWKIAKDNVDRGLSKVTKNTGLHGRWEILKTEPKVICDVAHNEAGLSYVLKQLKEEESKQLHIVMGVVNDKDLSKILPLFPKTAHYYFCRPDIPRGLSEKDLKDKASEYGLNGKSYLSVNNAYNEAIKKSDKEDLVFVGGSTFTVAEVIALFF